MNIIDTKIYYMKYKHNKKFNGEKRSFLQYYREVRKNARNKTTKFLPKRLLNNIEHYKFIISREDNIYILKNIKNRIVIKLRINRDKKCYNLTLFKRNTDITYLSMQGIVYGEKAIEGYDLKSYKDYRRFKNKIIKKYAAYFAACERMRHDSLMTLSMFK